MIELLTKLDVKPSAFPDNFQNNANTSQVCPECVNQRKATRLGCWRCAGSGRLADTGAQNQSRNAYYGEGFTPSYVASLLAGIERHKADAALVYVTNDMEAAQRLVTYLQQHVIKVASFDWNLTDEEKQIRVAGLCAMAARDLAIYPVRTSPEISARVLGISRSQWFKVWRERHDIFFGRVLGWTDEVNQHMTRRHYGERERA